jgi:hypothetical protein
MGIKIPADKMVILLLWNMLEEDIFLRCEINRASQVSFINLKND